MERYVRQGEDGLIMAFFNNRDGNELNLSALEINLYILQNSIVRKKFIKGVDQELIISGGQLKLTYTSALTLALKKSTTHLLMELIGPSDIIVDAKTNNQFIRKIFKIDDRASDNKSIINLGNFKTIFGAVSNSEGTILTDQNNVILTDQDNNTLIL
jgi:hypothetical protein